MRMIYRYVVAPIACYTVMCSFLWRVQIVLDMYSDCHRTNNNINTTYSIVQCHNCNCTMAKINIKNTLFRQVSGLVSMIDEVGKPRLSGGNSVNKEAMEGGRTGSIEGRQQKKKTHLNMLEYHLHVTQKDVGPPGSVAGQSPSHVTRYIRQRWFPFQ